MKLDTVNRDDWVLAVLAALALVGDLAVERLSPPTRLPALGGSRPHASGSGSARRGTPPSSL